MIVFGERSQTAGVAMFALDKLKKKSVTIWKFFPLLHSCKDFDIFDSFSIFNHYNLIIILIHNEGRPIA